MGEGLCGSMGGHFAAFWGDSHNEFPGNFSYESGGASLYAFLLAIKPRLIYIPNYICESVPYAIDKAGVPVRKYSIGPGFDISYPDHLADGEYFLVPDYFGVSADLVCGALENMPAERVIVDCAQAYFAAYPSAIARIYSPRKFLPVADGGFVATDVALASEPGDDQATIASYQYLLRRTVTPAETTREAYLDAEERMNNISLRAMSGFTGNIIRTLNQEFIKSRRRENFQILDDLSSLNRLSVRLGEQTPLCYPLMIRNAEKIWQALLRLRIYTPRYWPGIEPLSDFENALLSETLFLPLDHRYDALTMASLRDTIVQLYHRFSD